MLNGITYVPQSFVFDKNGIKKFHHPTIFEGGVASVTKSLYQWLNN